MSVANPSPLTACFTSAELLYLAAHESLCLLVCMPLSMTRSRCYITDERISGIFNHFVISALYQAKPTNDDHAQPFNIACARALTIAIYRVVHEKVSHQVS